MVKLVIWDAIAPIMMSLYCHGSTVKYKAVIYVQMLGSEQE